MFHGSARKAVGSGEEQLVRTAQLASAKAATSEMVVDPSDARTTEDMFSATNSLTFKKANGKAA